VKTEDLKCETCGLGARDVAPGMDFGDKSAIYWTCHNGHKQISGWRPEIKGLVSMLEQAESYKMLATPVRLDPVELDSKGRAEFLSGVETRIDAMMKTAADHIAQEIFYSPPVFLGREWPKPSHWAWRTKMRWKWLAAREWLAEKVLRVDIHQGRDYDDE
jgi:hypothetical protein